MLIAQEGNKWRTEVIDLYDNIFYRNFSAKKSPYGTNLLGDNTYTGQDYIDDFQSDIGFVDEERFIDTSSRIDINQVVVNVTGNTNGLEYPLTVAVYCNDEFDATPYYDDATPGLVNDWVVAVHRNPRYPVSVTDAPRYAFFEVDFDTPYDTSNLDFEVIVTLKIDPPSVMAYFESTKRLQDKFPEWMAMREYNALDEEKATPATPESMGGQFLNAAVGEWISDIDRRLKSMIYDYFIDTVDLDKKVWIYKTEGVPDRIYTVSKLTVSDYSTPNFTIEDDTLTESNHLETLTNTSSVTEFYETSIEDDAYFFNPVTREIYTNKKYDYLLINNEVYVQNLHQLWTPLDDIGVGVDLFRLSNESNDSFRKRILDIFINKPGVGVNAFKLGLRRELNLWKYSDATPATPDSFALGATPDVFEISDIEKDVNYFINGIPTRKFIDLAEELATKYPLLWGYLSFGNAIWDPDGLSHNDFGILPRQLDATPLDSQYLESGVVDGNDLYVFKPQATSNIEDFNLSLRLRGKRRISTTDYPKIDLTVRVYGTGLYTQYINPEIEENITIRITLDDGSQWYCNTYGRATSDISNQNPSGTNTSITAVNWTTHDDYIGVDYIFSNLTTGQPYVGRISLSDVSKVEVYRGHYVLDGATPSYRSKSSISDYKIWFQDAATPFIGGGAATPNTSLSISPFDSFLRDADLYFQSLAQYSTPSFWTSNIIHEYKISINGVVNNLQTQENFVLQLPKDIVWPSYVTDRKYAISIVSSDGTNFGGFSDNVSSTPLFIPANQIMVDGNSTWTNGVKLIDSNAISVTFSSNFIQSTYYWELFEAKQSQKITGKVSQFGPWRNNQEPEPNNTDYLFNKINVSRKDFNIIDDSATPSGWESSNDYMVTWIGIDTIDNQNVLAWTPTNSIYSSIFDGNSDIRQLSSESDIKETFSGNAYEYGELPIYVRLKPTTNTRWNPRVHSGWLFDTDETYYLYADSVTETATNSTKVLSGVNRQGAPIIVSAIAGSTPIGNLRQVAFWSNDSSPSLSIYNKEIIKGNGTNTFILAYKDVYDISVQNTTLNTAVSIISNSITSNVLLLTASSNKDFTYEVTYKVRKSFYFQNDYVDENGDFKSYIVFDSTPAAISANSYEITYENSLFDPATPIDVPLNSLYSSIDESFIYIDKNTYPLAQIEARISQPKLLADGVDYALVTFRSIDTNGNPKPFSTFNLYTNFGYINPSTITTDRDGFAWAILRSEPWDANLQPTPYHYSLPMPMLGATPPSGTVLVDGDIDATLTFEIELPVSNGKYMAAVVNASQIPSDGVSTTSITGVVKDQNHNPLPYAVVYWRKSRTIQDLLSNNYLVVRNTTASSTPLSSDYIYGYVVADSNGVFNIGAFSSENTPGYWFVSVECGSASPGTGTFSGNQFPMIGDVVYWYEYPNVTIRDTTGGAEQYTSTRNILPYAATPEFPISIDEKQWTDFTRDYSKIFNLPNPSNFGKNSVISVPGISETVRKSYVPLLANWTPPMWYAIDRFTQYQIGLRNIKMGVNNLGIDILPATPLYPDYKEF